MRLLMLTFFFVLFTAATQTYAAIDKNTLDQKIQTLLQDKPVKGMIYGLWVNGKPVSINAIGDSMTAVPATTDMHFRIGGVTETMLTTLLMQLVEQKQISLDDKIARWYPNLPNANNVTVNMLANCTSGYPDYVYNEKFIDDVLTHPFKQWSDQALFDYAFMKPQVFAPGTNQHYTHTDYVILGGILSKVSKMPLAELFQSHILKKLSMQNTVFNRTATIPSPVLHSFSNDRKVYEEATFWDPSWTASSGSMVSQISDLGIWANAWMKGSLLSKKSTQQLRSPDTVGKGNNKENLYFAMGFGVANHWLIQNPAFGGYSGVFAVLPEKNLVFIAFNTLKENATDTTGNLSLKLWQNLAADLAPDYPAPEIK